MENNKLSKKGIGNFFRPVPFLLFGLMFFLIGNAISYAAQNKGLVIVGLGDSTTAGTPAFRSPAEDPPGGEGNPESQYGYWLMKRHPEWRFLNRGMNAQRSDQILARFDADVLQLKPDAVIILAGVVDLFQGYPVEPIKDNLKEMYARARGAGIRVMACTVLPYNISTEEVRLNMKVLNRWIYFYSREQGLGFCDTNKSVADPKNPDKLISSPDSLHPDVDAYRKMGEAISDEIENWLKRPAAA